MQTPGSTIVGLLIVLWGIFCLTLPDDKGDGRGTPRYVGWGFIAFGIYAMLFLGGLETDIPQSQRAVQGFGLQVMYWLSWFISLVPLMVIPSVVIAFLVRALALDTLLVVAVFGYTLWFIPWARGIRRIDQEIWRGETHSFLETEERIFRSYSTTRPLDPAMNLLVLSWMTFLVLGFLQTL